MKELPEYLETIEKVKKELEAYSDALQIDDEIEQEIVRNDNEVYSKELPAYSDLLVDSNIPHNHYDDYTHKRPAGFEFLGQKYLAKEWKDIFVQTCEALAEKEVVLFSSFVVDNGVQGRKVKYFCTDKNEIRSHQFCPLERPCRREYMIDTILITLLITLVMMMYKCSFLCGF